MRLFATCHCDVARGPINRIGGDGDARPSQNGRYTFHPVADGVLRLDTPDRPSVGVQSERCRLGLQVSSR